MGHAVYVDLTCYSCQIFILCQVGQHKWSGVHAYSLNCATMPVTGFLVCNPQGQGCKREQVKVSSKGLQPIQVSCG